jgi:hypothetical protein
MIHVPAGSLIIPIPWKTLADAKTEALKVKYADGDVNVRNKFIDDNAHVWQDSRIKDELLALSHGKCWFTEARDKVSYFHIEHFRPKKEAWEMDGNKRDGYWWRSFDHTNFRICGAVINRPKACYFPLQMGSTPGTPDTPNCRDERPVFLDPTNIWDVGLVSFDGEGKFIARDNASTDDKERVRITQEIFKLNEHQPLIESRLNVWQKCSELITAILSDQNDIEAGDGVANAEGARDEKLKRLKELADERSEFAGVARAAVMRFFPALAPALFSIEAAN